MKKHLALAALTALIASVTLLIAAPVASVSASTCQETGEGCAVGMTGPKGGIIFYDAGSQQWWGRFLEAEKTATKATGTWGLVSGYGAVGNTALQRMTMAVGMGRVNTGAMLQAGSPLAVDHASTDWFIPSKDELDALYDFWKLNPRVANYRPFPVWTSSESEDAFAWYQLFLDGTQFTDANGIIPNLKSNKMYQQSARHVGSDFAPAPMHVIRVRSFPYTGALPPFRPLVDAPTTNTACSQFAVACQVGNIGPGGGIIVYDAGSNQSWGRYLEIAPKSCEIARVAYSSRGTGSLFPTADARVRSKAIGAGAANTRLLTKGTHSFSAANFASRPCNGFSDWFLPSKGELNEAFRWLSHGRTGPQLTPVGQFERGYYWTSSDYNGRTAWTQYFADGQQFDRVQTLSGNMKPPARPFYVRPMRAFGDGQFVASQPTEEVTGERSLFIVGDRAVVDGKDRVIINGQSDGYPAGTILKPWLRFPGQTSYAEGNVEITVRQDGTFTWSRKTGKKTYVYVKTTDGTTSNTVIIPAK